MRTRLVKIIYHKFRFKDEIKKNKTFIEEPRKKIKNQNNEEKIKKNDIINLD
jgi:hypothetical protein